MLTRYKLGELVNVTRGMSLPGENYSEEGELVRLTLGNFDYARGGFKENTSKKDIYYTGDVKDEYILKKGDIITPLTEQTVGLLGSTAMIPESGKYIQSQDVALVTCTTDKIDPLFCYYLISSDIVRKQLSAAAQQTKIRHTSPDKIMDCVVWVPELSLQQKIGKTLYTIEKKISLNTRINAELEAMAKQLYDYWFVQFDFPDENGNPYKSSGGKMVYNEKLKREIPEGWEDDVLSNIANITMGQSPDGSSYNETGEGTIFYQGSTDFGIRFPSVRMYTTAPSRYAKKGDILMSVRAPVGDTNIANSDCCIGRGLSAMSSKIGSTSHLYYIIRDLKAKFDRLNAAGTTFGAINKDELCNLPVVRPNKKVLQKYEALCAPIFNKQMNIGYEIEHLTHLRDSLLPMLMNGQVVCHDDKVLYHGTDVCMLEMSGEERKQFFADCKLVINSLYEQCHPVSYAGLKSEALLYRFYRYEKQRANKSSIEMFSKIEGRAIYLTNSEILARNYAQMAKYGGEIGSAAYTMIKKAETQDEIISDENVKKAIERVKYFVEEKEHEPVVVIVKNDEVDVTDLDYDEIVTIDMSHYMWSPLWDPDFVVYNVKYSKPLDFSKCDHINLVEEYHNALIEQMQNENS